MSEIIVTLVFIIVCVCLLYTIFQNNKLVKKYNKLVGDYTNLWEHYLEVTENNSLLKTKNLISYKKDNNIVYINFNKDKK